jgi:dihydrofolate reductase
MAKVRWHVSMSLDGFTTGPDDGMDWVLGREAGTQSALATEFMNSLGAIVAGRRWYDIATARYRGVSTIYGGAWKGPVFVLTHRPLAASVDPTVEFLSTSVIDAVDTAARAANGKAVGILGANIAQQCVQAGLVDDILVHLVPVLLGDGVPLYRSRGLREMSLERAAIAPAGESTDILFRVLPPARSAVDDHPRHEWERVAQPYA